MTPTSTQPSTGSESEASGRQFVAACYNIQYGYGTRTTGRWADNERSSEELIASALRVVVGESSVVSEAESRRTAEELIQDMPRAWVLGIAENYSPHADGTGSIAHAVAEFLRENGEKCELETLPQLSLAREHFQPGEHTSNTGVAVLTNCSISETRRIPLTYAERPGTRFPHEALEVDVTTPEGVSLFVDMAHLNVDPRIAHHQVMALLSHFARRGTSENLPGLAMGDWNYPRDVARLGGVRRTARKHGLEYAHYEGGSFPEGYFQPPYVFPLIGTPSAIRRWGHPVRIDVERFPGKLLRRRVAIDHVVGTGLRFSHVETLSTGSDHRAVRAVALMNK